MPYAKALRCRECGREYPLEPLHVCEFCFGPLEVAYDYEAMHRNLTRESFVKAMESIKDWDEDKLSAPITFGPDRRHGGNFVRLMRAVKASDGSIQQITGYQTFPPKY